MTNGPMSETTRAITPLAGKALLKRIDEWMLSDAANSATLDALSFLRALRAEVSVTSDAERNQRIVDLVCAEGSRVYPSVINPGLVVVVDGRTGLDACERSAVEAFDALFREADGGDSPSRVTIVAEDEVAYDDDSLSAPTEER